MHPSGPISLFPHIARLSRDGSIRRALSGYLQKRTCEPHVLLCKYALLRAAIGRGKLLVPIRRATYAAPTRMPPSLSLPVPGCDVSQRSDLPE